MIRRILWSLLLAGAVLGGLGYLLGHGVFGRHEGPGDITPIARNSLELASQREERLATEAALDNDSTQILFGDLHVHTTFSADAFVMSLPLVSGEGSHPPADACDFARHCAALDFWSINDHAESLTPAHWQETIESIRACNAVADPTDPDVIAFLGWEWTQDGTHPDNHWGHKNVIIRGTEDESIPARPIAAQQPGGGDIVTVPPALRAGLVLLLRDQRTLDFTTFLEESAEVPPCPTGIAVRELPENCRESTETPAELFAKLDDWGMDTLVIPHGTTWGNTAPPGSRWDAQIAGQQADPDRQFLMEVYSGHGNAEEYRDWGLPDAKPGKLPACPAPIPGRDGFLPNCWRAGEIIQERCLQTAESTENCDRRAADARRNHAAVGRAGFRTVPGASVIDWQDAGQCRDCFLPAFDYRPRMSAQYMLAKQSPDAPTHARYGLIASSDNHTARPGTGYKERDRSEMSESKGPAEGSPDLLGMSEEPHPYSVPLDTEGAVAFGDRDVERMSSFFTTGGLVAVHAEARDRDSIWQALQKRHVYGTSGPRILLHFDLLNPADAPTHRPMGSESSVVEHPRFRVSAAGSRVQRPGCPETSRKALGPERLYNLCRNECYHPGDERRRISRIEVVRIRPQTHPDEPIAPLIEDPWKTLPCPPGTDGCRVEFEDLDYLESGRSAAYYVRAIQEPTPAVNGQNLRCRRDETGRCLELNPCFGNDAQTAYEDDCLATIEERAWSSPIWIDQHG